MRIMLQMNPKYEPYFNIDYDEKKYFAFEVFSSTQNYIRTMPDTHETRGWKSQYVFLRL